MNRRLIVIGFGLSALALTACSPATTPSPAPLPSNLEKIRPTDAAPADASPLEAPPAGFKQMKGDHYTVAIPADWDARPLPSAQASKAKTVFLYQKQGTSAADPERFGVVLDEHPVSDVIEQSEVLKTTKQLYAKANVTRSEVSWPGTERAVIVEWTEVLGQNTAHPVEVRQRQLFAQVSNTLIVNAVAVAPPSTFDSSPALKVLQTFRPTA